MGCYQSQGGTQKQTVSVYWVEQYHSRYELGELVTVTAGSGIGKSLFCREIAHHLLGLGETVGYIALKNPSCTALGIMGIHMNKPLHLDDDMLDEKELKPAFDRLWVTVSSTPTITSVVWRVTIFCPK